MELETVEIEGGGGTRLFVHDYRPESDGPAPIFFCVHGLGEHGGRYGHLSDWMVERGWRVIACDLRGHGRSSGTRTHVLSFDEYIQDLALIWRHFDLSHQQTTVFAHSMGGLIAVRAIQTHAIAPGSLVLSSPLLGLKLKVNPLKRLLGQLLVSFFPKTRFSNDLDPNNMTRDSVFADQRRQDPFIVKTVTAGWFFAMQRAIAEAHRDAAKITIPIFAVCGLADVTTDSDALSQWIARTKSPSHELVSLPAHVHEVFHESDWRETAERMLDWLDRLGVTNNR